MDIVRLPTPERWVGRIATEATEEGRAFSPESRNECVRTFVECSVNKRTRKFGAVHAAKVQDRVYDAGEAGPAFPKFPGELQDSGSILVGGFHE